MTLEAVLEEWASARAGYRLASFKEAAIPVYVLTARIVTLDTKKLNPIEEGCLKAIESGLESPIDIGSFLGLHTVVLSTILASLNSQELVSYRRAIGDESAVVSLTSKGRTAVAEAASVTPQEKIVKITFDPILRRVVFHHQSSLWRPREVKLAGRFEVPLCGAKRPEVQDVSLEDIDRAIQRLRRHNEESTEVLALRRIERREMFFVPCTLLYYSANIGKEVLVAFHLEEGLSLDHENAFRSLGGPDQIDAKHVLITSDTDDVNDATIEILPTVDTPAGELSDRINNAVGSDAPTLRTIRCHEHPPLLRDALTKSSHRFLVVSPWIREQVVDKSFLQSLEALLRNGLSVYVGYGLVEEGGSRKARGKPAISPRTQSALEELQNRFNNFSFRFVGNTHRKVLVSDTRFAITTSFNWLSFKGDPREKPRDESGTLISKPAYVEEVFRDALDLLQSGYEHPRSTGRSSRLATRV